MGVALVLGDVEGMEDSRTRRWRREATARGRARSPDATDGEGLRTAVVRAMSASAFIATCVAFPIACGHGNGDVGPVTCAPDRPYPARAYGPWHCPSGPGGTVKKEPEGGDSDLRGRQPDAGRRGAARPERGTSLTLPTLLGAVGSWRSGLASDLPGSPFGPHAAGLWPLAASGPAPAWEGPTVPGWAQVADQTPGWARDDCFPPCSSSPVSALLAGGLGTAVAPDPGPSVGRSTAAVVGRRRLGDAAAVRRPLRQPGRLALRGRGQDGGRRVRRVPTGVVARPLGVDVGRRRQVGGTTLALRARGAQPLGPVRADLRRSAMGGGGVLAGDGGPRSRRCAPGASTASSRTERRERHGGGLRGRGQPGACCSILVGGIHNDALMLGLTVAGVGPGPLREAGMGRWCSASSGWP